TLQTKQLDVLTAYAKASRNIELHRILASLDPAMFAFVNGHIGVSLRELGIKPEVKPAALAPLITATRSFRSALETIGAATRQIGAVTKAPLVWCAPEQTYDLIEGA